jgi:hypothetical protein
MLQFVGMAKRISKKAGKGYQVSFVSEVKLQEFLAIHPLSHKECIDQIKSFARSI